MFFSTAVAKRCCQRQLVALNRLVTRRALSNASASAQGWEERDVVIVGGGPVGLALASALGSRQAIRKSLRIALIEAGDLSHVRDWMAQDALFSNRVSSLTNASLAFLESIGALEHVDLTRTAPIEDMQVWDGLSDARVSFAASELMSHAPGMDSTPPRQLGRLTENMNLQRALMRRLGALQDAVDLCDNVKVSAIVQEETEGGGGWPLVHLSDGRVLRARLLVGADGFNSPVRVYSGIPSFGWPYDAHSVVATLNHLPRGAFEPPNTTAYQRFLPTGPIAFLPLSPTVSSLVWSTKPQLASALTAAEPLVLKYLLNAAFRLPEVSVRFLHNLLLEAAQSGSKLTAAGVMEWVAFRERSHGISPHSAYASLRGEARDGVPPSDSGMVPPLVTSIQAGTIASFPLRFSHTESYIGEGTGSRTVLVGDAAHTIHPLAGQGLNLGLADADALARCIHNAVNHGSDVGSLTALRTYARERYFENHKIMAAVDKLHKLYSVTSAPVVWARSVGAEVLNELDFVKAAMVLQAGSAARTGQDNATWAKMGADGISATMSALGAMRALGNGVLEMAGAGYRAITERARM